MQNKRQSSASVLSGPLWCSWLPGTVRGSEVFTCRGHTLISAAEINTGHFDEYSWPCVLQGDESGGGQEESLSLRADRGIGERTEASGWSTLLTHTPTCLPPSLPLPLTLSLFAFFILKAPRGKKHRPICWSAGGQSCTRQEKTKSHRDHMRTKQHLKQTQSHVFSTNTKIIWFIPLSQWLPLRAHLRPNKYGSL